MIKEFLFKVKLKINNIEKVKISKDALWQYKYNVRNNDKESDDVLILKIIRNFNLGTVYEDNEHTLVKRYGNLAMYYSKGSNKITYITNKLGGTSSFTQEMKDKKHKLNMILGLN